MKIDVKIKKMERVPWESIQDLQPMDFKNDYHSEKIKQSILKHNYASPIHVWDDNGQLYAVDGHLRMDLLKELKGEGADIPDKLPVVFLDLPDRETAVKYLLEVFNTKSNPINQDSLNQWMEELDVTLEELDVSLDDLHVEIDQEVEYLEEETVGDDDVPDVDNAKTITVKGDLYELGNHRLLCGDSTMIDDVEKLMDGEKAVLAHNDPPYGMKKEKDGVKNDNLNYDALLEFNRKWINLQFAFLNDNGSFYCWGIDEPLMDIYSNILKPLIKTQKATFRNLITWNKGNGQGQMSEEFRSYAPSDEKCLFVMCGVQGFNNNADNYFDGWDSIRLYLVQEKEKLGLTNKELTKHLNSSHTHYWTTSQWAFPTKEHYTKLQELSKINNTNSFKKEYDKIKKEYDKIKKEYDEIKKEYYSTRAYFNNTHDNMTNVWDFKRTDEKERQHTGGHATPKPLELCNRVIMSSSKEFDLVTDWFLGSGSTLIACEKTNRKCYGMELGEKYCDVIVRRWVNFMIENGKKDKIVLKRNGQGIDYRDFIDYE